MSDETNQKILENMAIINAGITTIKDDITVMKADVRQNTIDLTEHKAGVVGNRERIEIEKETRHILLKEHEAASEARYHALDSRLQDAEVIPNFAKGSVKVLKWIGIIAASLVSIYKLSEYL